MNLPPAARLQCVLYLLLASLLSDAFATAAPQVLVVDRITSRVLSYDVNGNLIGVVLDDPNHLDEPNALALSHDRTQLYVTSREGDAVVRYDFNGTTASNPQVLIDSGVNGPANLLFSDDGQTLYVANLGDQGMAGFDGSSVSQFDPNGTSAGPDLTGGFASGRSGLAFDPAGNLMVSAFGEGTVYKYNSGTQSFETFIGPESQLAGAGNLLVVGNSVLVPGGFSGSVLKYDATSGVEDTGFGPIFGLEFPASLALAPDGSGFLLGILGFADGTGRIEKYTFDGELSETYPNSSADPNQGFAEASGLLTIFDSADFDTDGDVDDNDLALWEAAYGLDASADADFDGDSDGRDFLIWQQQYTGDLSPLISPATAVPEPSSVLLALTFACAGACCRSRRSGGSCSA